MQRMTVNSLFRASAAICLLVSLSGCLTYSPFCDGLNESNMPARLVIVEASSNAQRYRLPAEDGRLASAYDSPSDSERDPVVEGGRLVTSLPSCRNIDGFDGVQTLRLERAKRFSERNHEHEYCTSLSVDARSAEPVFSSVRGEEAPWRTSWPLVANSWSNITSEPRLLENTSAYGELIISPVHDGENEYNDWWPGTGSAIDDELLYQTAGAAEEPPVILLRQWTIRYTEEAAAAFAYLGVEEREGTHRCGDYYFGYYTR